MGLATVAYVPPFASSGLASAARTATATTAVASATVAATPTTFDDGSSSFLYYFTIPYLDAHVASAPTYRYAYILWFIIAGVLVLGTLATQLGVDRTLVGAAWRKVAIRRITFGKLKSSRAPGSERKKRWSSPTLAGFVLFTCFLAAASLVSVLGPDHLAPTSCLFGSGRCEYASVTNAGPPRSTLAARARVVPAGYAPFNDPLLAAPNFAIQANWWTAGNRLGLIAYALLPLCVMLALKQWPFNLLATPWLTDYHFDQTVVLHRWSGRIVWVLTSAHVATWTYQLAGLDRDPFGRPVLVPMWDYWRFKAGCIAYILLTLLVLLSIIKPLQKRYYELFYWSHVVFSLGFLAACMLHFKPLFWWCAGSLILWGAERLSRLVVVGYINVGRAGPVPDHELFETNKEEKAERSNGNHYPPSPHYMLANDSHLDIPTSQPRPRDSYWDYGPGQAHRSSPTPYERQSPLMSRPGSLPGYTPRRAIESTPRAPPGFALAQLLPGRTVRLTITTVRPVRWIPGQHIFLNLPAVAVESHPYTLLNVDERARGIAPLDGGAASAFSGSTVVLLIRAQKGFSKKLFELVRQRRYALESSVGSPTAGICLRAAIGPPTGSAGRAAWGKYSSLCIVVGGTGCTFGVSILDYACRRIARRDAMVKAGLVDDTGEFLCTRVRFVWVLREYAHLAWIAPTLRRCLDTLAPHQLQLDLYVSRDSRLAPTAPLASQAGARARFGRDVESPEATELYRSLDQEYTSITDLVLFDGEEDVRSPVETELSNALEAEGRLRRARSRRVNQRPTLSSIPMATNYSLDAEEFDRIRSESPPPLSTSRPLLAHSRANSHTGSTRPTGDTDSLAGASSIRGLLSDDSNLLLDLSPLDREDLDSITELARPGNAPLDVILDEEIRRAEGRTMVACCGPRSLNTMMRGLVASRIDLSKLARGDLSGDVALEVEDFSF